MDRLCKGEKESAGVAECCATIVRLADGGRPGKLTKVATVLIEKDAPALVLAALTTHGDDAAVAEHGCVVSVRR